MAGNDRQELEELRRIDELEAKAAGRAQPASASVDPAAAAKTAPTYAEGVIKRAGGDYDPIVGGIETALNAITGFGGKVAADIGGLGAMGYNVATGKTGDVESGMRSLQRDLTYEPRTKAGKAMSEYNPAALVGKGVDWIGEKAQHAIAPEGASTARQMAGAGTRETLNQALMLLGAKSPDVASFLKKKLESGGERMMTSALKPTFEAHRTGKAGQAVDTMLKEGLNVSPGGVEQMQARISDLNSQVASKIAASPAIVNKQAVMTRMQSTLDEFYKQVNPNNDLASIQKALDEFDQHPLIVGNDIPVKLAQELKQGTYRRLGDKSYGELKSSEIEAQKALARGLKEEISKAVPEVSPLNAEESKLLNALSVSERRVMMEANKNPMGLGLLSTNPLHLAAWMADRSGLFKSLVARMLHSTSEALPGMEVAGPVGGAMAEEKAGERKK